MIFEGDIRQNGPLIPVWIRGADGTEMEGLGLIDTGAQHTIVDVRRVREVGARVLGSRDAMGACGTCTMSSIALGMRIGIGGQWEEKQLYAAPSLPGQQSVGPGAKPLIAAIGWDWLKRGRLSTDGMKRRWRFVMER